MYACFSQHTCMHMHYTQMRMHTCTHSNHFLSFIGTYIPLCTNGDPFGGNDNKSQIRPCLRTRTYTHVSVYIGVVNGSPQPGDSARRDAY